MKKIKVRTKQTLHLLLVLFLVVNSILCFSNGVSADTGNGSGNNKSLNNFTSGVLIDGRVPDNPMTNVIRGKEYEVSLKFTERENLQFDNTSMTYTMPSQFQANSGTKKLNVIVTIGDNTYEIKDNVYTVDDNGNVNFQWNTNDSNFSQLTNCANAQFTLNFTGTFNSDANPIDFGNNHKIEISFSSTTVAGPTVRKTASYNANDNKVYYTVEVSSVGNSTNVKISDTMSGTALTYDANSFQIKEPGNWQSTSIHPTINGKTFEYTIPEIQDGQTYQITYAADVDLSQIALNNGYGTIEQTKNDIKVTDSNGQEASTSTNLKDSIKYTSLYKSASEGNISDGKKTTLWTITYNSEALVSMKGHTIKDTLNNNGTKTSYSGSGIKIQRYKKDGTLVPYDGFEAKEISWNELNVNSQLTEFSYTIPENDDELYKYVITYTTLTDVSSMIQSTQISNQVSDESQNLSSGFVSASLGPEAGNLLGVSKSVVSVNDQEISWKIQLHVPKIGLSSASIEDDYPTTSNWYNNEQHVYYDSLKENSIQVTGLLDGENYQIDVSDNHQLKITFYKDTEKTQTGLQPSTQERDIVITLTTKVNQDWLNDAESGLQAKAHVNNIKFTGGGNVVTASASAMPVRFTIEKKATDKEPVSYTAEGLPVYRFDVIMTGVTEALELQDTFDTRYFKLYNNNSWDSGHLFYGQDQWYQGNDCGKVTISSHNTGINIICPSKIIQKDSNGNYYPYYKISYYLQVKDTNALKELKQQAAINGGTIGLTNTIESNGKTSSTSVNYKYNGLSKELLNESSIGGDNTLAKYKITINPDEIKMNQGQKFNVVDEFENLRIDYTSITVCDKEGHDLVASQEVTYNFIGNKGTFTIPDKKTIIIQYDAYVIETGYVTFKNKISYANYVDEKSCSKNMNSQGSGSASLLSITILKCEEGMTSNKLEGAEFQLFRSSNDEKLGNSTYITDKNGTVTIAPGLNEDRFVLYSGTQYYLKEVKAPEGYQCSDTKYYFEIDENNQVDYDNYVYANKDIIKISNKKISIAGTQQSAKFTLKANKTLSKGQLNGLDYTFELKNKYDNSQTSIASNDAQGNIEFESIEFNEAKDYAFELYEKVPQDSDSPIIYDTTKYEILIRVEVDTDNNLKVTNVVVKKGDSVVYTSTPSIKWASYELDLTSLDKPTFRNVVKVSTKITKVNTMNEKLSNATFVVKDKEGNTVKTWQSSKDSDYEIIDNLVPDEEYTLSETQAPEGYDIASPITFIVKENGDVYIGSQKIENNMIVMTDTLKKYTVDISKVDEQALALKGAKLKITGKNIENQEITPIEFTSSTENISINDLEPGTYTLTEVEAPDGYELSDSIQFSISNDGKVIINNQEQSDRTITMIDRKTSITVGKYDIETKEPLSGCVIQILDENKDVVSEVNTTIENSEIEITGLKVETQYYFKEHIAPQGYAVNKYLIPFVLRKDGTLKIATINSDKEIEEVDEYKEFFEDGILKSKDNITSVKISKVDIVNENELSGAIIQIIDSNGQIVKEWTSTHQPEEITGLKTGEVYTLKEIVAPRGYSVTTDTKFVLKEDGTIDHTKTTTSINEEGILLIEDSMLFVEISKVDATTQKKLAGACLEVYDSQGHKIDSWISSDSENHIVTGIKANEIYTIKETVAPSGYEITSQTTFVVDQNGDVIAGTTKVKNGILIVENQLIKENVKEQSNSNNQIQKNEKDYIETGDESQIEQWSIMLLFSFLSFICLYLYGIINKNWR